MGLDEGSSSMNMGTTAVTYIDTPESDTSLEQLCWIGRPGRGVLNRGRLLLGHVVVLVVALVFEGINLFVLVTEESQQALFRGRTVVIRLP